MIETSRNRFSLLDLMILVAGTAFAFWIVPEGFDISSTRVANVVAQNGWSWISAKWIGLIMARAQPITAVGTATLLALAYGRSRSFRELAEGPGSMACIAALSVILVIGLLSFTSTRINLATGLPFSVRTQVYLVDALTFRRAECGIAIASAWLTLLLIGHWSPQGDWIDRSGLAFGFYWIAMIPITWLGFQDW